jgi:hypothetical protein
MNDNLAIVAAWHDALNRGDFDTMIALSADVIEVGGPRGRTTALAAEILREWVERAGIHLETRRWFQREGTLVVEESAIWRDASGEPTAPAIVASAFSLEDGRVRSVIRYGSLHEALAKAGLTADDETDGARV